MGHVYLKNNTPRMHHITPFLRWKIHKFSGKGHSPSPDPPLAAYGASILASSALDLRPPMFQWRWRPWCYPPEMLTKSTPKGGQKYANFGLAQIWSHQNPFQEKWEFWPHPYYFRFKGHKRPCTLGIRHFYDSELLVELLRVEINSC